MVPFSLKNDIQYSQMQIEYSQFVWYNGTSVNWHSIVDEKVRKLMRKGKIMAISYNGLWKLLIDNNMNKGDLCKKTGLSSSTMAKMTNGESVKLSVLERICKELNCNFADLVDYVDDSKVKKEK